MAVNAVSAPEGFFDIVRFDSIGIGVAGRAVLTKELCIAGTSVAAVKGYFCGERVCGEEKGGEGHEGV